jgi:hypothetical protein
MKPDDQMTWPSSSDRINAITANLPNSISLCLRAQTMHNDARMNFRCTPVTQITLEIAIVVVVFIMKITMASAFVVVAAAVAVVVVVVDDDDDVVVAAVVAAVVVVVAAATAVGSVPASLSCLWS